MPDTIFVIGMDDFNRGKLDRVEAHSEYRFHSLFTLEQVRERQFGDVHELLTEARDRLDAHRREGGSVDGIIAYWDFPVQTLLPILRADFDLPGPSLEGVLRCEHKYWSRIEQQRVIPEHVPDFVALDPFDPPADGIDLEYPFWLKPVKATNSQLGFRVDDDAELDRALEVIRDEIGRFGHWFDQFLQRADLPPDVAGVRGGHCVAESLLPGTQHTLSGWVNGSSIRSYGVVDSHTFPGRSPFASYRYPSLLPDRVRKQMAGVGAMLMDSIDFAWEAFNIEFFYDDDHDRLGVLEVNPRMSQSHGDLYDKVDGLPNHKIAADLAVGRIPSFPFRDGAFRHAGKFYLRRFRDGVVARAPTDEEVRRAEREVPGTLVEIRVREGDRLGDVRDKDSYSYELAHVYVGADEDAELQARFERVAHLLPFAFEEAA